MPVTITGSNTPTSGGVVYGDGTTYVTTLAGTSGQILVSAGSGAPVWGSSIPTSGVTTGLIETTTITASSPAATQTYDVITQAVQFYTSNAGNTWVINLRGNSGTTMNSLLATGQAITVAMLVTQGASGASFYNTSVQVDGTTSGVTTRWQGGTAPSAGYASGIDVYSYTIIKTASATYTVLAALTQFK